MIKQPSLEDMIDIAPGLIAASELTVISLRGENLAVFTNREFAETYLGRLVHPTDEVSIETHRKAYYSQGWLDLPFNPKVN